MCFNDFDEYLMDSNTNSINIITAGVDPIDMLCSNITDLSPFELKQPRSLLTEFRDIFAVSIKKLDELLLWNSMFK